MVIAEALATRLLGRRLDVETLKDAGDFELPPGVILREGRLVPWLGGKLARMRGYAAAVTLGRTIVINPGTHLTPLLLTHELAHVRQWQTVPLFPIRYAIASLRHGYLNNPYEIEARTLATSAWPTRAGEEWTQKDG